jgi:enoyl-CoA hydratase
MSVRTSVDGPVLTVVIDRPKRRNAVDPVTAQALREAFAAFGTDSTLSVAVLAGAGGAFCAGFDLKALSQHGPSHDAEGEGPMGPTRMALSKPVIAAIEGPAVAGGLELALWCDLRVASATAVFGVYCRRWGVPLIDGGTVRLSRLIGESRAMDMILTGRPVDAPEALSFGLANRVVAAGEALAAAQGLAAEIARFPQACLRADRASARAQWDRPLPEALRAEARGAAPEVFAEAVAGATRFASGLGRGGDFSAI